MIRKKGILLLIVLTAIFFLITWFFTDSWFESQIEDAGTSANGALVELDGFSFSIFSLSIEWDRLQVTDPQNTMKNRVETGRAEFNMEFIPLLSGKIVIENIELSDIKTNTDRETDGALPVEETEPDTGSFIGESVATLEEQVEKNTGFDFSAVSQNVNADSIFKLLDLKSPEKIKNLQKEATNKYDTWKKTFETADFEKDAKNLQAKIKAIDVKNIKSAEGIKNAITGINDIKTTIDSLTKFVENTKKRVEEDINFVGNNATQVDDWIKEDYQRALSKAKLPEINAENIGKMVFGKEVVDDIKSYLGYVEQARYYYEEYLASDEPKEPDPPRFKGQDIYFYNKNARPDLWIKQIKLSGETESQLKMRGLVTDIVSDQRLVNKTTIIDIGGENEIGTTLQFNGVLDYLADLPSERFDLSYKGFVIDDIKLSESELFPGKIRDGRGVMNTKFEITGEQINAGIDFAAEKLKMDFSASKPPKGKIQEVVRDIIAGINKLDFHAKISGTRDNMKFDLSSSLDKLFMNSLNRVLDKNIAEAKQKIKDRIDKEITKYKKELDKIIEEQSNKLKAQLAQYENILGNTNGIFDSKKQEIEDKKNNLGDLIGNGLKGLFK